MKNRKLFGLLVLASLLLTACQGPSRKPQSKRSAQSSVKKNKSQSERESATSAQEPEQADSDSQSNNQLSYKGQYYSLSGKYGEEVIIVNKKYPLDAAYAPGENPVAKQAFLELINQMRAQGYALADSYSGFRSYEEQSELYQSYAARDGQANADRYSARPGHSEHQTGLAFDLREPSGELLTEVNAATWLRDNAHHYGFIVRYPEGKEEVTGYMAESWHIRYIGQEAKDIYASGKTLEEYYGVEGGTYKE